MNKKLLTIITVLGLLALSIGVVAAQGRGNSDNGNRNNNGNNNRVCDPAAPDDCLNDAQVNAYNYGGMGFVNPEAGEQWNGRQRGNMGRGAGMNGTGFYTNLPPAYDGELPQEIIALMLDGWMDEQHAYAVYEMVINQFGAVAPFTNIQRAEAQHIAAWEMLFDRYNIEIPAVPTFDTVEFASAADACSIAAEAEVINFDLYDTMLEAFADYPDIHQIALSLRNASEFNHLPAFQNCAN